MAFWKQVLRAFLMLDKPINITNDLGLRMPHDARMDPLKREACEQFLKERGRG